MKISGNLNKTESDLVKTYAAIDDVRAEIAELKDKERKLLDKAETLERLRVLQVVQLNNIDIEQLKTILSAAGKQQIFTEAIKAPLTERVQADDEEIERNEDDEEDE
ncbi:MAG: hypothetical protein IK990_00465 [Ruminiclostridium sp.]|nr:hypothetical protein [Ruminiclostridium sp.]